MGLVCDYPCRLDLWAEVVKAKHIQRQVEVLNELVCIPEKDVEGKVSSIDDVKVQVVCVDETFLNSCKVKVTIDFNVILIVVVGENPGVFKVVTLKGYSFSKTISLDEFDPPLSPQDFKEEVERSQIVLKNWNFDVDILGNCEEPGNPCYRKCPIPGTCVAIRVYVDIIDKLTKFHDIVVYGELDPEVDP